jgi:tetratricopeptide (TPR) repeat protein
MRGHGVWLLGVRRDDVTKDDVNKDLQYVRGVINKSMRHRFKNFGFKTLARNLIRNLIRNAAVALVLWTALPDGAGASGAEPTANPQTDPAPCFAAITADDADRIVAVCSALVDNEKTAKDDRLKALIARAVAYDAKDQIDRAIGDYDTVLRLDPTLADVFNTRGELWRKKGDRRRAVADFSAAITLNPDHPAARANRKALAQELERIGALMAVGGKPSFDCATAKHAAAKAICANPELANLDREITATNARVVRQANEDSPRGGQAAQREQDEFIARRNAAFGRPDYDLPNAMRERLDHLKAIERK